MGGEGNMQHMINTLRNNRSLLRKKSMFKRDNSFLSAKKEYYKAAQGKIDLKKATKEELSILRKKIIKQRRTENIRVWITILVLAISIILFSFYISNKINKNKIERIEQAEENYLHENFNEYTYLIEEGDKWIEKKNWNNAIYRYAKAVELFPNEFEANYRLALAYSYSCQFENKNCEIGIELTNKLLKYFPDENNLIVLKKVFEK